MSRLKATVSRCCRAHLPCPARIVDRDGRPDLTGEGYPIDPQISIPVNATSISISKDGIVAAAMPGQSAAQQFGTIEIATFQNPGGLKPLGGNMFTVTTASGEPQTGAQAPTRAARSRRATSRTRTSRSSRKW
jgi:flagellar basal body rod protein FlgG